MTEVWVWSGEASDGRSRILDELIELSDSEMIAQRRYGVS